MLGVSPMFWAIAGCCYMVRPKPKRPRTRIPRGTIPPVSIPGGEIPPGEIPPDDIPPPPPPQTPRTPPGSFAAELGPQQNKHRGRRYRRRSRRF